MNEAALKKRIDELNEALAHAPVEPGKLASEDVLLHSSGKGKESVDDLLDHLRLQVKYLMFDLEATKRENSYLRRMLEARQKPGEDGDGPKW